MAFARPLPLFTGVRLLMRCAARARRRAGPGRGSDGWPFAALRVPCDARVAGLWPNSLRSLRSLRSNKRPQVSSRSALRARPATLCFSAAPIRPAHAPPGALRDIDFVFDAPPTPNACGPEGGAALGRLCAAEERRACGRARSALRELTRRTCSSAVSAANVASCATGPQGRAPQGTRSAAKGQHSEPRCRTAVGPAPKPRRQTLWFCNGPRADKRCTRHICRRWREARWSN